MIEIPKRRWFQFHLSTAVVFMFIMGGFMWANGRQHYYNHNNEFYDGYAYGWPTPVLIFVRFEQKSPYERASDLDIFHCTFNLFIAVSASIAVAIGAERLICYREARKNVT